jgi:Flp pilus assembly protein TadD/peroxiredoxin
MGWTPMLFLPAPLLATPFRPWFREIPADRNSAFPFHDFRLTPHYPAKSPLDEVLRRVLPGTDQYVTEKYAFEVMQILDEWASGLKAGPPALAVLAKFVDVSMEAGSLTPAQEKTIRSKYGIEVVRRQFGREVAAGRERFLEEMKTYLAAFARVETAELEIVAIEPTAGSSPLFRIEIRYDIAGTRKDAGREERIGHWTTEWSRDERSGWRLRKWQASEETVSRAREPIFIEVTAQALGRTESYRKQLLCGVDYWRTVLDGACGLDIYGNNGLAVGDIDNDGLDDFYVCQPAGLPNRLYRNRGDGSFEDVTEKSGVEVLDATACALFADFENKGRQDLLVVCGSGPLLFLNQGQGSFQLKRDAFQFTQAPQGTFTHAAVADYDRDGRLDIYFCLYSYYLGLDQYHYPAPYFDARNGPPNFLLHNEGNATFQDRTEATGLNADNDRYSFACAWGDCNSDGWPDLYVANDFGRNNLYRNNGDGIFQVISSEAGVEDVGAGMSACWFDYDNDGKQDLYAANMWSAAGMRVSADELFQPKEPENIRALYRQHARGNSLYRNAGNGKFQNVSSAAGVDMGRWAWSSDAWDFDLDGYADLYIANGYVSGPDTSNLSSFFWRQVVGNSPASRTPSASYEQGWQAINELVRSDRSWCGYERNVLYLNNHDTTFSDISGVAGMDFPDDSRSFVLADVDHDGRLEVLLKNRNAPQLRILRNAMKESGNAIALRLRGTKSNRDAIGTAVTVEAGGKAQTRYLQAGSGFLSQHTKELFFGVGDADGPVRATIRWPNGLKQSFAQLPINRRIEIEEGAENFVAIPFAAVATAYAHAAGQAPKIELPPSSAETWLIEPLRAPEFTLLDLAGVTRELRSWRGGFLLLTFWTMASETSSEHLRLFQRYRDAIASSGMQMVGVNVDAAGNEHAVRTFVAQQGLSFPTLLATQDVAGIYNIIYRHLFDRRRDLGVPTSLLLDAQGQIVKIYQGTVHPDRIIGDIKSAPGTAAERMRKALPFEGTLYGGAFARNDFTYGVALFQHGYLEQAAASFEQVIAAKPQEPEAYYNLGTLYLRKNDLPNARRYLEQTVKLHSNHPEAWNNLGMVAAQEGHGDEAIKYFEQSLQFRPDYATALVNVGNLYRRQGDSAKAEKSLSRAVEIEPKNPEANYSLGMLYARQDQLERAAKYLQQAVDLRPDYPDALNNLGVLYVREKQYEQAKKQFTNCIQVDPNFDQGYLNLARLYVILEDKQKAREVLQALLKNQPQNQLAQQALEVLR